MGLGIHTIEPFVELFVVDAGIMLGTQYGDVVGALLVVRLALAALY